MKTQFSRKEHNDSGMALILILLIVMIFYPIKPVIVAAIVVTLVTMIYSPVIYPFTVIWLNFSHFLGNFMSKVILSAIFFVFVVPVAVIRKLARKDSLQLKKFKKDSNSVFIVRDHDYTKADIEKPY